MKRKISKEIEMQCEFVNKIIALSLSEFILQGKVDNKDISLIKEFADSVVEHIKQAKDIALKEVKNN